MRTHAKTIIFRTTILWKHAASEQNAHMCMFARQLCTWQCVAKTAHMCVLARNVHTAVRGDNCTSVHVSTTIVHTAARGETCTYVHVLQNAKNNLRMWIQNKDQNNKIRRQTNKSSCQTTAATKTTSTTMMGICICAWNSYFSFALAH